jgi:hypothetical protein
MLTTTSRPAALGLAVGSLAVLAGCQAGDMSVTATTDELDDTAAADQAEVVESSEAPDQPAALGPLADGTYTVIGGYQSPADAAETETIVVTLSIIDGIITEAVVQPQASHPTSRRYQDQFAGGVAEKVVDKPLAEVEVTRVAGSSLTGRGFNEALDQIRAQAQASDTSSSSSSY